MLDTDLKKFNPPFLVHSNIFRTYDLIKNKVFNKATNNEIF